jgi:hypothetical protein
MQAVLSCHAAACTQEEYTSEGVAQQQFTRLIWERVSLRLTIGTTW